MTLWVYILKPLPNPLPPEISALNPASPIANHQSTHHRSRTCLIHPPFRRPIICIDRTAGRRGDGRAARPAREAGRAGRSRPHWHPRVAGADRPSRSPRRARSQGPPGEHLIDPSLLQPKRHIAAQRCLDNVGKNHGLRIALSLFCLGSLRRMSRHSFVLLILLALFLYLSIYLSAGSARDAGRTRAAGAAG